MSIDDEFEAWYSTVQVYTFQGTGAWGETFADPVAVEAFAEPQNRVVVASDGKSIVSDTKLFCGTQHRATFAEGSKVILPDDLRVYRVAMVKGWYDDDSHLEVNLT